jgi:hypothetical protein
MTPKLTDELRLAIEECGGAPVYVVDDSTNRNYVLIRAEQFEKVRAFFYDEDIDPRGAYPAIDRAFKEGWDDPAMDVYDDYDANRPRH